MLAAFLLAVLGAAALAEEAAVGPFKFCSYNLRNWLTTERYSGPNAKSTAKPEREKEKVVEFITEIAPTILGVCEIGTI